MPGRNPAKDKGPAQQVQVARDRGMRDAEGTGDLRAVPDLRVIVRGHAPETTETFGWDLYAQLRDIALEERPHEVLPPRHTLGRAPGQVRTREPSAKPEPFEIRGPDLGKAEAAHIDERHPARERLRDPLDQIGRRAAEDEKSCARRPPIGEHAKQAEQLRLSLNLVDHDQAGKRRQGQFTLAQTRAVDRALQVEERGGPVPGDGTGEGRLPALPRPQKRGHRRSFQGRLHAASELGAIDAHG